MIVHWPGCSPDYPEKPEDEPPQFVCVIPIEEGDVVQQCADCGAFEIVHVEVER